MVNPWKMKGLKQAIIIALLAGLVGCDQYTDTKGVDSQNWIVRMDGSRERSWLNESTGTRQSEIISEDGIFYDQFIYDKNEALIYKERMEVCAGDPSFIYQEAYYADGKIKSRFDNVNHYKKTWDSLGNLREHEQYDRMNSLMKKEFWDQGTLIYSIAYKDSMGIAVPHIFWYASREKASSALHNGKKKGSFKSSHKLS